MDKDVAFADADRGLDDQIDAAYRAKYRRYSGTYVDPMVAPQSRATTIKARAPRRWLLATST